MKINIRIIFICALLSLGVIGSILFLFFENEPQEEGLRFSVPMQGDFKVVQNKTTTSSSSVQKRSESLVQIKESQESEKILEKINKKLTTVENNSFLISEEKLKKDNIEEIKGKQKKSIQEATKPLDLKLYSPVFGNSLVRGHATAHFLLLDAKGKLLEPYIVKKVRIWRNYRNELWLEDNAIFNHETSSIECLGFLDKGLEPGYYSVEVDGGGYGVLKFNFDLGKDENFNATYKMPNFSKVIAVHFVDKNKNDVAYISNKPSYKWEENKDPFSAYENKKVMILKNAPNYSSGGCYRSVMRGCGSRREIGVYKTNNGKMYLRVFSGQDGEINYVYDTAEGPVEPFVFKNNFANTDTVIVTIAPCDFSNYPRSFADINKMEDGDWVGINVNKIYKYKESPFVFNNHQTGFSYQVKHTKYPLALEYIIYKEYSPRKLCGDGFLFQFNMGCFSEETNTVKIRLKDDAMFKTEWEVIPLQDGLATTKEVELDLVQFKVSLSLTPTMLEMTKDIAKIYLKEENFPLQFNNQSASFTSLYISGSDKLRVDMEDIKIGIPCQMEVHSKPQDSTEDLEHLPLFIPNGFTNEKNEAAFFKSQLQIDAALIQNDPRKELSLMKPFRNLLIWRNVNRNGAGLPLVEASLIAAEDLKKVETIKKILLNSAHSAYLKSLSDYYFVEANEKHDSDIYIKLKSIFTDENTLNFYIKNGSWYNATAKSVSDGAGYLILQTEELVPGKIYTLFLWNESDDELKPDKEINFIAQEGVTDLGVIQF